MKTSFILFAKIASVLIITMCLSSCYKDKAEILYPSVGTCDTANSKYGANVSPILMANCATSGCHTTSAMAGGYAYQSHSETLVSVNNGKLIASINHKSGASQMPKGGSKLSDCDINKIQAWINRGALNN